MMEDPELLRRYVEEKSEAAFAELVRRRIDLVYSVALRQVGGDAHLAEDVAQKVFVDLARKAPTLTDRLVLSGWLYRSTHYAASDVVRSERRRRAREQESQAMHEANMSPVAPAEWEKLRPLLDEAMSSLDDEDRDAVSLRFFEGRPFAEIGRVLRVTEDAARKRVERALDRMGASLSRRGVTSTSTALGLALANQITAAAPAGLASTVTGSALAGVAAGGAAAAGVGFFTFMNSAKFAASAAAIAGLSLGTAVYEGWAASRRADEIAALSEQQQRAVATIAELRQRVQSAEQRAVAAEQDTAKLLRAVEAQKASRAAANAIEANSETEPLTHDSVQARYRRAQQLARTGDPAEALRELLWCFDTGMPRVTGFGGVRMSFLLSDIAKLGERYAPALEALRERRDKAEKRLLTNTSDFDATQTFSSINRTLKENARTLAVLDQLPANDSRRSTLAMTAFEDLVTARRYADAAQGKTFSQMGRQFEMSSEERPLPPNIQDPDRVRQANRNYVITSTANNIEVLAGIGQLDNARILAKRLLGFDGSAETKATLQQHVERAGQPKLLEGIAAGP
jgi:RNA polymerase sigma factor (sigma-70 family)